MKLLIRRIKTRLRQLYQQHAYRPRPTQHQPQGQADILYSIDLLTYGELHDFIDVQGWFYHPDITHLLLQLDGQTIASIQPTQPREDVRGIHPQIPAHATPGFSQRIAVDHAWLNSRGASRLTVNVPGSTDMQELATSTVFSRQHYPAAVRPDAHRQCFYFTVGSSNITLGGFGDFKEKLAPFAIGSCQLGFMVPLLYMRSTKGSTHDWEFDPAFDESRRQASGKLVLADSLNTIFNFARDKQIPCVIGLNGGIWGDAAGTCPEWDLTDHLEQEEQNCQWNQHDQVMPDDHLKHLTGAEHAPELSRSLTLNHYNQQVRSYKKRNLQQAASHILQFAAQHPDLYIASNLDPDCYQNPFFEGEQWYDYNPQTLQQFRDWLAGTGAYAAELKHSLQHAPYTLDTLNQKLGTSFTSWSELQPPREQPSKPLVGQTSPLMQLWEQFRRHSVHRHYSDLSQWLVEAGMSHQQIFSSQGFTAPRFTSEPFALTQTSPVKNYDSGGMSLAGSKPEQGHIGAILYGESARNNIRTENGKSFFQNIRELDPDWAVVEFNPADLRDHPKQLPDYAFAWDCLRQIFNHGARYLNLMAWNGNTAKDLDKDYFSAHMALRDTPLEAAVIDFMLMHSDIPRGSLCYTFGSNKHACLEGWSSKNLQLTATNDGLQFDVEHAAILQVPQPWLLAGKQRVCLQLSSSANELANIRLQASGTDIAADLTRTRQAGMDCYELQLSRPLAHDLQDPCLELITDSRQNITLHRVVFD